MNKIILTSILILLSISIFGQYMPRPVVLHTIATIEDTCDNKYCVIDFSDKYLLALNYITQNDSNLQFKKIKISERPMMTSYSRFFKVLDEVTQKKVSYTDSTTMYIDESVYGKADVSLNIAFDNQRFQLPDSLYTTTKAEMTIFFSKILDNDLFVRFTSCFPELSHNYDYVSYVKFGSEVGCDDFYNLYYFKFENNEIYKIYKLIKYKDEKGELIRVK